MTRSIKHLNFHIQAKSSAVAAELFQILAMRFLINVLSNIYTTVMYKQFSVQCIVCDICVCLSVDVLRSGENAERN